MESDDSQDNDKTDSIIVLTKGLEVGHYRIVEKIGAGGMGEVWLAEDTELKRQVALKYLPEHLCRDEDCRARFKREAQATAALKHPNIVTIYEVSEYKGRPFFAMEHIEGKPLRDIIKSGQLSIDVSIEIAMQICAGLNAAHEAGIVHRDIKPGNIIIDTENRLRLLDFGLATIKGGEKLTKTGSTIGTVGYMSPEQVRGENVCKGSDLFSVGVILYEMITGKQPFYNEYEAATMNAIVNDTPEPIARFKSDVPHDLQRIVTKLLEKNPTLRYQSADGVIPDLKKISSVSTSSVEIRKKRDQWNRYIVPSAVMLILVVLAIWYFGYRDQARPTSSGDTRIMLAVLPFENLGDSEDEYFAEGITEEITSRLAKVKKLIVIGSRSAKKYKETEKSISQIGQELGVSYLLCGTIRWQKGDNDSSRVRVTPQLLKVSDASNVWSDIYEDLYTQIFSVQSSIANQVVNQLGVALADSERGAIEANPTNNLKAYDFYIRARDYFWTYETKDDVDMAISFWLKAIELDSTFIDAWVELSVALSYYHWAGWDITGDKLKLAHQAALSASRHDSLDSYSHLAMGYYYYYSNRDYQKALKEFEYAAQRVPNNHLVQSSIGYVQRRIGYWEESLRTMIYANQFEPLLAQPYIGIILSARAMRQFDIAEEWLEKGLSLFPDYAWLHREQIQLILARSGDTERALEELKQIDNLVKNDPYLLKLSMTYSYWAGNFRDAIDYSREFITQSETYQDTCWYLSDLGKYYLCLNDTISSQLYYDSAKTYMALRNNLNDEYVNQIPIPIGIVYAELGEKKEAIRLAKKQASLLTISKDALSGPDYQLELCLTYIKVGQFDNAVAILDSLLNVPSEITVSILRVNRDFAPIKDHPGFQALLEEYEDS